VIVDGVVAAVPAMTILWTASRASAAAFPPVELADRVVRIAPDQAASPLLAGAVTLVYVALAGALAAPEACPRAPRGRAAAGLGLGCAAGAGAAPQPVDVPATAVATRSRSTPPLCASSSSREGRVRGRQSPAPSSSARQTAPGSRLVRLRE